MSERKSCNPSGIEPKRLHSLSDAYDGIILDFVGLAPSAHHEGVVVGQDGDDVDTLFLELWQIRYIPGEMVFRAGRREGA